MSDLSVHQIAKKFASWAAVEGFFDGYGHANIY